MKLSVIVPIYNVSKYLNRCIKSLLNQTLSGIEIILVDDESPDECPTMCNDYALKYSNIKVIHKKNGGLGFARNSGLEVVTGEYVAFLDSDDFVDTTMYEELYNFAHNNNLDACFCGYNIYYDDNNIRQRKEFEDYTIFEGKNDITDALLDMVGAPPKFKSDVKILSSVWKGIYKLDIIKRNNIKFVSEREYIAEDIIFHLDFLPHCQKIGFIPQTYHYYCDNGASLTRALRKDRFAKELYQYAGMEERLNKLRIPHGQYINHLDRYLLLKIRSCITQIVNYSKSLGKEETKSLINEIINDDKVRGLTKRYPYDQLYMKHKVFFLLIKYRLTNILYLSIKYAN